MQIKYGVDGNVLHMNFRKETVERADQRIQAVVLVGVKILIVQTWYLTPVANAKMFVNNQDTILVVHVLQIVAKIPKSVNCSSNGTSTKFKMFYNHKLQ